MPTTTQPKGLLTYDEASELLFVPTRTIRTAVARGELQVTRFNRRVHRIDVTELRLWRERVTCRKPSQLGTNRAF